MSKNIMENSFDNDRLENEACDKFENLINSFSIATHSNGANDEKSVAFPNEYGGAFYADGKLNICLTDVSEKSTVSCKEIVGDDNVNYIKCIYPYNYLREVNNYIVNLMSNNNDKYAINTVGITQRDNVVNVSVSTSEKAEELSDELISKGFEKKSFDIIVDEMRPTPAATYARPGDRVYTWTGGTRGSHIATIGFNAKNSSGKNGFVTAEHALWYGKNLGVYEYDCSSVSNCTASKSTDSCFVPFNSGITGLTGLINNSGLYGNTTYKLTASYNASADLEGVTLTGFGKESKKYTGVVLRTSVSYSLTGGDGTLTTDALEVKTAYKTPKKGDSGGTIAKIKDASVTPQTATLAGILSATSDYTSTSGNYTLAYVPKVKNITTALNVTFYGGSN